MKLSVIQPPRVGPTVGPTITPIPKMAPAIPRSSCGKTSNRIACAVEISAPPPIPCAIRAPTSISSEPAWPQRNDAAVNSMIEPT